MTLLAEPMTGIGQFQNRHQGEDVYVLGAGSDLNYLRPRVLRGKTVVAVNSAARVWGCEPSYVVVKEHAEEAVPNHAAFPDVPIICSAGPYGNGERPVPPGFVHVFEHLENRAENFDVFRDWPTEPDQLVVSLSTITSAMHFAAYMGAGTIVVLGHHFGTIEGETHVKGYGSQPDWMPQWMAAIERQSLAVKRELLRRYDCDMVGLTPWISPNLDGLSYRGGSNSINAW